MNDEIAGKLAEFELLSKSMKVKKQEIKKAIFYAKHPQLRIAKDEVEKVKEPAVKETVKDVEKPTVKDAAEIFNRTLQEQVKEPAVKELAVKDTVKDVEKPAVKDVEKPAVKEPVKEPIKEHVVQQGPVVVTLGGKWF